MNNSEPKQVIVVRKDLKMGRGKIAAQAAHASMKVFFDMMYWENEVQDVANFNLEVRPGTAMWEWKAAPKSHNAISEQLLEKIKVNT